MLNAHPPLEKQPRQPSQPRAARHSERVVGRPSPPSPLFTSNTGRFDAVGDSWPHHKDEAARLERLKAELARGGSYLRDKILAGGQGFWGGEGGNGEWVRHQLLNEQTTRQAAEEEAAVARAEAAAAVARAEALEAAASARELEIEAAAARLQLR